MFLPSKHTHMHASTCCTVTRHGAGREEKECEAVAEDDVEQVADDHACAALAGCAALALALALALTPALL